MAVDQIEILLEHLKRVEAMVSELVRQRVVKQWYTTTEIAEALGKSAYSVREWARLGRIHARKKPCGRGRNGEWVVSHEELTRLRNEGLLPARPVSSENRTEPMGNC
jgi:hypothetical protein